MAKVMILDDLLVPKELLLHISNGVLVVTAQVLLGQTVVLGGASATGTGRRAHMVLMITTTHLWGADAIENFQTNW